jgi:Winged helix DNA-binding domain
VTTGPSPGARLSRAELNRTLLRRQFLDAPAQVTVEAAVEHLAGVQAQLPAAPYVGLWSRLARFVHDDLARLIEERQLVRVALMRSTLHLVTARDCLLLRPAVQQALDRELASVWASGLPLTDMEALLGEARAVLKEKPLTFTELGARLLLRWPQGDARAMAYAVRNLETLVQVPPRGLWGKAGAPRHVTAEQWLGEQDALAGGREAGAGGTRERQEAMVLRYLAAFGPATIADMQAWSGVTRLVEVVEPMRPRLRLLAGEDGRELWDLDGAPIADAGCPAPLRFLPEYDNALLGHADRGRVMPEGVTFTSYAARLRPRSVIRGALLASGFLAGTWSVTRADDGTHVLSVEPFARLSPADTEAAEETGRRLLTFVTGNAGAGRVELAA